MFILNLVIQVLTNIKEINETGEEGERYREKEIKRESDGAG